eukprot:m.114202 g.114202  ORF g.114202 m.114202 type:complete len:536 (-) comp28338_c2_seq1:505-2112(-)
MVLLSASICNKSGKALVGRQFMEVSRSRIEGLLAAFPKLIKSDGQHTFVETENVRYVYQPLDSLFMVLITTKNSNILEDLETLRLFSRVVPEYCPEPTEATVSENAFELIFAFDEIVALGYRENVTLSQIRTFTEMDSHDENIHKMIQMRKVQEQKDIAKRKAKEFQSIKRQQGRSGMGGGMGSGSGSGGGSGGGMGSMGSMGGNMGSMGSMGGDSSDGGDSARFAPSVSMTTKSAPKKSSKGGMRLGSKGKKKQEDFIEQLQAQGQNVIDEATEQAQGQTSSSLSNRVSNNEPAVDQEGVHLKIEEKIVLEANRDGVVDRIEIKGIVNMQVNDENLTNVKVRMELEKPDFSFKTHPNVDKKQWQKDNIIGLKSNRPFPVGTEVGVVKWNFTTTDETLVPITINCWPQVNSDGSAEISCDYELTQPDLELENVSISIAVPSSPVVNSIDGEYKYDKRDGCLLWTNGTINSANPEGSLEFTVKDAGSNDDFFPVTVSFTSKTTFAGLKIGNAFTDDDDDIKYSSEVMFTTESYEFV